MQDKTYKEAITSQNTNEQMAAAGRAAAAATAAHYKELIDAGMTEDFATEMTKLFAEPIYDGIRKGAGIIKE